jgi:hypothetical protein
MFAKKRSDPPDRFLIRRLACGGDISAFAADVRVGLGANPILPFTFLLLPFLCS